MHIDALANNVVRLPTAARRKVINPGPMSPAVRAIPRLPVAFDRSHGARPAYEEANFQRSPEMLILMAMFRLLPDAAKAEIRAKIGTIADLNLTPHAPTALYILECAK